MLEAGCITWLPPLIRLLQAHCEPLPPTYPRILQNEFLKLWELLKVDRSLQTEQEVKDLWHIWDIYLSIYLLDLLKHLLVCSRSPPGPLSILSLWLAQIGHMVLGVDLSDLLPGADLEQIRSGSGADQERIYSNFLTLWLAQRDHMTPGGIGRRSGVDPSHPILIRSLYSEPLFGLDISHGSARGSGRDRERIRSRNLPRFLTCDSNSTSELWNQMC